MATQLALQRNFVTIKSSNQSTQSSQTAIMTSSSSSNGGEIVTITAAGNSTSETSPIHVMQPVQPVSHLKNEFAFQLLRLLFDLQKKFILQAGTTSDGVSIIDVVPIDQSESTDDAPITVSAILPTNSGASSPNSSNSQQITAQVAFVQAPDSDEISETKSHFITVNGKWTYKYINLCPFTYCI